MKLLHAALAIAALFVTFPAYGEQSAGSPQPSDEAASRTSRTPADAARDARARLRFAPMWMPVPKFEPSNTEPALPVPSAAYAITWQPQWQEELGLSDEQKKELAAINAKAVAEAEEHAGQFKKLSPEEQQAEVNTWAGKSAPWRQQLDREICREIERVLTPQQLQTVKDFMFPRYVVGLLYDAKVRQEVGFTPEQEDRLRSLAKDRLAKFQEVWMEQAEKLWNMLTPQQQAALPEVVKHQGPTSAALSIAWDLGFELDNIAPGHPMLGEAPVRKRLGLSAEQESQWHAITTDFSAGQAELRQEQAAAKTQASQRELEVKESALHIRATQQVEAVLTPEQLAAVKEIDFHRRAALALHYPEKRRTVGITPEQDAEMQRLEEQTHERLYDIDCEMLDRALEIPTPRQQEQLREEIDRLICGESEAQ
jgi:hypothetical protein